MTLENIVLSLVLLRTSKLPVSIPPVTVDSASSPFIAVVGDEDDVY